MHDNGQCRGFQQLSLITTTASSVTIPGIPAYANAALIRSEVDVRYRLDGVAPTTGSGMQMKASDTQPLWIEGIGLLENLRVIATTGAGVIDILYFGAGQ